MAQLEVLSEILKEEEKDNESATPNKYLYRIEYTANREVLLNGKLLRRPRPDSPNENLISYLIAHPNKVIKIKEIEKDTGIENISLNIHQKIRDLGFTGNLKKIFFPQVDQQTIKFTNPITENYLTKNNLPRLPNVK